MSESVTFALWFSAWVAGAVSLDHTRDAIVGGDAAHDVLGVPSGPGREHEPLEPVPLILALGRLRGAGAEGAGIALPVPGDPLGLAGPVAFNHDALEQGQAVVLAGVDLGLVPHRVGAGVVWRCSSAASRRQVPDLAEADTTLRRTLPAVADALAGLDVARWRPEVADELMALRTSVELDVPPGTSQRAQRMIALASRCRTIVRLALEDDGAAVTAGEADRRRAALDPLDRAARQALVAATAHPFTG